MILYTGVVENRNDPLKLGRCQVRVVTLHNHDKISVPTEDLPWAYPLQPLTSAAMSGIGHSPLGPVEGTWVVVMFRDEAQQQPIMVGSIGGIPQDNPDLSDSGNEMVLKQDGYLPSERAEFTTTNTGDIIQSGAGTTQDESTGLSSANQLQVSDTIRSSIEDRGLTYDENLLNEVETVVQQNVKADVTQSMYDSLVLFAYTNGTSTLSSSQILKDLNANDYLGAATAFAEYSKINGEIDPNELRDRLLEKDKFIAEGIPNSTTGELVPITATIPTIDSSNTSSGQVDAGLKMIFGFRDPNGKYPLYKYEPDTNKLARHEDIKKTIVRKKEQTRDKDVITAFNVSWDQSPIPYNSVYPYNHVYQSESGHVFEFDDTQNSERIHLYHTKGTFFEIDANGTKVEKIVGDNYKILERNDHLYIKGTGNVTIDGDINVKINNNANIEVMGDSKMHVHGDMETSVRGQYKLKAAGINIESWVGNIEMFAAGNIAGDATRIDFNSGVSSASGLSTPSAYDPEMPTFKELQVITRGVEAAAHFETPEEGDPATYIAKRISEGTLDPADQDYGTEQRADAVTPSSAVALPQSCNLISAMDKFTPDLFLSKHFTLGALTKNGSRMPVAQQGLTAQEIVCNLKGLCENCLEPIAELYPGIIITSGFRRPGDVPASSKTSQHYLGQAADIVIPGFSRQQHYDVINQIAKMIPYDQLLLEYSGKTTVWIHVSFKYSANRSQAFTMRDHKRVGSVGQFVLIA